MTDATARHWDDVYSRKAVDDMSWYQPRAGTSMRLLTAAVEAVASAGEAPGAAVDVGAGVSTLASELLAAGWSPVTVVDVSAAAIERARVKLGAGADVRFVVSDILEWQPDETFDAWHDRALFHFLVQPEDQTRYVDSAARSLRPGGLLVIGTFGPGGPDQCSGLPVMRHDPTSLAALFDSHFELLTSEIEVHLTPWGAEQQFTWATLRRRSPVA